MWHTVRQPSRVTTAKIVRYRADCASGLLHNNQRNCWHSLLFIKSSSHNKFESHHIVAKCVSQLKRHYIQDNLHWWWEVEVELRAKTKQRLCSWRVCNLRLKKAHQLEMQTSLVMRWMNIQVDLPSEGVKNAYCSGDKIFQCSQPVVRDQSSLSSSRTSRYLWVHHLSVLAIYGDWQIVRRSRLSYLLGFCSTEMEATPTAPILNASTRTPLLLLLVFWSHNSEAQ